MNLVPELIFAVIMIAMGGMIAIIILTFYESYKLKKIQKERRSYLQNLIYIIKQDITYLKVNNIKYLLIYIGITLIVARGMIFIWDIVIYHFLNIPLYYLHKYYPLVLVSSVIIICIFALRIIDFIYNHIPNMKKIKF